MSLIEESLRKIQDRTMNQMASSTSPTPATEETKTHSWTAPASPSVSLGRGRPSIGLPLALLVLATFVGGLVWASKTLKPSAQASGSGDGSVSTLEAASAQQVASASGSSPTAQAGWQLSGLVVGSGAPYAVINGEVVTVGDAIGDATLEGISATGVTLRHADGKIVTLRVPQ